MSLVKLPPELLIRILEYAGSAYFREDIRRLAISKEWYSCAHIVLFMDLELSQKCLRRLFSSPETKTKSMMSVKTHLRTCALKLQGYQDWQLAPDTLSGSHLKWDTHEGRVVLATWTRQLDDDLNRLAMLLKQARSIRTLQIRAATEHNPEAPYLPRRNYLSLATVRSLVLVDHLAVLDLDTCGTGLTPPENHCSFHLCESISSLLATLKSLRLRLRTICAEVLRPKINGMLAISKIAINLSLSDDASPSITSVTHAVPCEYTTVGVFNLRSELEKQALQLADQMACPQLFRILGHSVVRLEMQSLDVLSGKRMILANGGAWEDDGTEVISPESDDSSEIPSLSSDTD